MFDKSAASPESDKGEKRDTRDISRVEKRDVKDISRVDAH